jgi:hypothetical protein
LIVILLMIFPDGCALAQIRSMIMNQEQEQEGVSSLESADTVVVTLLPHFEKLSPA